MKFRYLSEDIFINICYETNHTIESCINEDLDESMEESSISAVNGDNDESTTTGSIEIEFEEESEK